MSNKIRLTNFRWKIAQSAELRWWKNYLRKKNVNEYLNWKRNYWSSFLDRISFTEIDLADNTILDAGCGPAGLFLWFKKATVVACDPLIDKYAETLPHFKKELYPHIIFKNNSIEDPISERFTYVFCINAINHVSNLSQSFCNLTQAVAKNGWLIISIDAHNHSILKYLFRMLPGDILHPHQYDLAEYKNMLASHNFNIVQEQCIKRGFIFNYHVLVAKYSK